MTRPRALLIALAAAVAASGCAGDRLMPGPKKDGYAVMSSGETLDAARRAAVSSFFDLFLSSASRAANAATLDEKVLSKARSFIVREKVVEHEGPGVSLRAVVAYTRLGRELDALGMAMPDSSGKPRLLISLKEQPQGAGGKALGRASDAMRRVLLERGYTVIDDSDSLGGGSQRDGSRAEALASARRLKAEVVVTGTAKTQALEDARLNGLSGARAVLDAEAVALTDSGVVAQVDQEATGLDRVPADAEAKALESAGELAGERLHEALASIYQQRVEFSVAVLGLGNLARARQFLEAARALPPVAAAALDAASGTDVRFRMSVERQSADEFTATLLGLKDFKLHVRSIEGDFNTIEVSSGELY